jgi:polysaccharide biosynthesis transport protein
LTFRRNLLLFSAVAGLVILAVAAWTLTRTPIYESSASLLVEIDSPNVVDVKAVSRDMANNSEAIETQVRIIGSPEIARRAATLYATRNPSDSRSNLANREALAQEILGSVSVARVGVTFVIDVTALSSDPAFAAAAANCVAEAYLVAQREAKVNANSDAGKFLAARTTELRAEASKADAALQQYKINNGLMSAQGSTMAEQEISTLNQQIAQAEAELAEKQGRLSAAEGQLRAGGGGADVGAALGSGTIGSLRQSEAAASTKVAEMSSRYGPLHPDLNRAKSELAEIRSQIQQEIDRILSNLKADVRVAASRLSSLRESRARANGSLAANNSAAVGLMELERRAEAAKGIYETFLKRLQETSAQEGLQAANARLTNAAAAPEDPIFPNRRLAAVIGLIGGVLAGLGAVAIAEYARGSVRTKSDIEKRLRIRYAGAIPDVASTLTDVALTEPPQEYVLSHPFSLFAESFRSLQAVMLLGGSGQQKTKGGRIIAITSALPQEGKTTTSTCLARVVASSGARTVLVDCDLRRRGSSALLIKAHRPGLVEYLAGEVTLDEALVLHEPSGMYLLGTSAPPTDARDPLSQENLARMTEELRQRFDVVILDTAPVLGVADARVVAAAADRVLVIARWAKTSFDAVEAALEILINAGAKISGVALSQVDIRKAGSTGHNEMYNYQRQFRGYYVN